MLQDGNFGRKMSFKTFRYLFIILLSVKGDSPLERQKDHQGCVKFHWNDQFEFSFLPNNSERWENAVRKITNFCLQNHSSLETRSCKRPIVAVKFPFISENPDITLKENLNKPVLAMKEPSTSLLHAFEQLWKLFIICLMAAVLSGILIWFFVSIVRRSWHKTH